MPAARSQESLRWYFSYRAS